MILIYLSCENERIFLNMQNKYVLFETISYVLIGGNTKKIKKYMRIYLNTNMSDNTLYVALEWYEVFTQCTMYVCSTFYRGIIFFLTLPFVSNRLHFTDNIFM